MATGLEVESLALKGCGFPGIAYEGSLEALRDLGQLEHLKKVVGSSAGALTAIGIATNCPSPSFQEFLMHLNSNRILDHGVLAAIGNGIKHPTHFLENIEAIGKAFGDRAQRAVKSIKELPEDCKHIGKGLFLKQAALFNGEQALQTIRDFVRTSILEAIRKKAGIEKLLPPNKDFGRITLGELHNLAVKFPELHFPEDVVLTAVNLTTKKCVDFSWRTHPDLEFAVAARASSSIPIVFEPVLINGDYYADGGLLNNFPIHELDGPDGQVNLHALALRVDSVKEMEKLFWQAPSNRQHLNLFGQLVNLLTGVNYTKANEDAKLAAYRDDGFRTIQLPNLGVGTTKFDIDDATKKNLIEAAYVTTVAWFALYREDALKNLNQNNIGRLKECLENLHARYANEKQKSPTSQFVAAYESCQGIYNRIMAPKPQPTSFVSRAEEDHALEENRHTSVPIIS